MKKNKVTKDVNSKHILEHFFLDYDSYIMTRGGLFVGIPNPTKKIPIPGILNPMGFLPKSVGSQASLEKIGESVTSS